MDDSELYARRLGTTLRDKWTLESLLGAGGMAAVYVGKHKIGRRDAIKILHAEIAANEEIRRRFEQEAHAVNLLKHPGAVEIRDFDVAEDGCPFLVMELLEGETLSAKLRREADLPEGELLRLMDDLLDVLASAHELEIIHRDIKLDNLFLTTDGRLKVLDFGIARMRQHAPKTLHTRTGVALGTPSYMSPEQAKGRAIDARVDIFAVGATMFRSLAKRRIHDAEFDIDLLIKMSTEPAPKLNTVTQGLPEALCLVVDRALEFDREDRYPNARMMQEDIRSMRSGQEPIHAKRLLLERMKSDTVPFSAVPEPLTARDHAPSSRPDTSSDDATIPWNPPLSSSQTAPLSEATVTLESLPPSAIPPKPKMSVARMVLWTHVVLVGLGLLAALMAWLTLRR